MIAIRGMKEEDAEELSALDKKCFSIPWSEQAFREESENELAYYIILTDNDVIIGYAGLWNIVGEGHITNIAVHPDYRGKGFGRKLMDALFHFAEENGLSCLTLEVRESNDTAINLYHKYGFKNAGRRKRYYYDNGEDAIVMTVVLFEKPEDYFSNLLKH